MSNFDIRFETNNSGDENAKNLSFSLIFSLREHSLSLGQYVIYPSTTYRELIFMPKYKFDKYEQRFYELSEKIYLAEDEKKNDVKPKNRKYYVSKEEVKEAKRLRGIISNAYKFNIMGYETKVTLPYKYIEMLRIKEDFMTFIQTDSDEFLIINPIDAWMYSANSYFNYSDSDNTSKAFFNKIKRAI